MEPEMRPFSWGWTIVWFGVEMAITRICAKGSPRLVLPNPGEGKSVLCQ